ncbi:MAG TPA: GNAT family N-acetyltransferase [Clostridia bacterium]|nr:GNAT family N-acetyltransferase [Clostridia bacterium]
MVIIRQPEINEAQKLWDMMDTLDGQTSFMLYEYGERPKTIVPQTNFITAAKENRAFLQAAFDSEKIVGYLMANRGAAKRNRHSAYIVTGILPAYQGQKIGSKFFEKMIEWASKNEVTRLELTVVCANERAVSLYKKYGFEIEGVKRNSLKFDGSYADEFYMSKIL